MFGNWSKRRKVVKDAESYLKATDVVSRPIAVVLTIVVSIIIGSLLFSVFLGGRWAYQKIKGDETSVAVTIPQEGPGESANTENEQQEFPPLADSNPKKPAPSTVIETPVTGPGITTTAPAATTSIPNTGPDESQP